MKSDFASKEYLSMQPNKSNLALYAGLAFLFLASLLPLKHIRDREEFRHQIEQSENIPYKFGKGQTIYTSCQQEGLEGWKIEECVDHIYANNTQLRDRFVRDGETILLPDINKDGSVGY